MGLKINSRLGGLIFLLFIGLIEAQGDSLRSALNAVDRRQKDLSVLSHYDNNDGDDGAVNDDNYGDYGYSLDGPDDLAFLTPSEYNSEREFIEKNPALERLLMNYIEDGRDSDEVKKRISSSFRERLEEENRERQIEELAQELLNSDNAEGDENLRHIWQKYRNQAAYNRPRVYLNNNNNNVEMRKRAFYPRFGLDSAGLRKRTPNNKYLDLDNYNDLAYLYYHNPRDEFSNNNNNNRYPDEDDAIDSNYYDFNQKRQLKRRYFGQRPPSLYNYPVKRFPVAKRSSNNYDASSYSQINHEHKRSTLKKDSAIKTDPKVAKDLSNLFGNVDVISTELPLTTSKPEKSTKLPTKKEIKATKADKIKDNKVNNKKEAMAKSNQEEFASSNVDKPLQIKKKSINWSDYFGIDRRKKSESDNDIDNEWLIERYHKALALTNKRNAEYPLQSFKNHDLSSSPMKKESVQSHNNKNDKSDDVKLSEIDGKLKNMEDTIIDDAIKYTGAHEDSIDSQEIQDVKDRIIARLAAAYSLEQMRRALGVYKISMAKEKERLKEQNKNDDDYDMVEEKRVSVPRKQAIDLEREKQPEEDNNIKCSQGDEDCEEQNYRVPSQILEQNTFEECPKVQRACSEVASILGHYGRIFETACNMHQMCLLCSNNSWFAPTRQCNVLFLSKAFELCDGKAECQKEAQKSVKYLLDVNRSLRLEPLSECELICPDRR